jgi:hypothetical protein
MAEKRFASSGSDSGGFGEGYDSVRGSSRDRRFESSSDDVAAPAGGSGPASERVEVETWALDKLRAYGLAFAGCPCHWSASCPADSLPTCPYKEQRIAAAILEVERV